MITEILAWVGLTVVIALIVIGAVRQERGGDDVGREH